MSDQADKVDALVIFGATGDLAKLETFPALVGLVKRGILDVPVIGVAKSGWGPKEADRLLPGRDVWHDPAG
jgi:glucose-6-phosphate 1-dehydrogenase